MADEAADLAGAGAAGDDGTQVQDRILPIANVARIMKRALPENAKIAKDAKECVQECVSEFISFITSEASDKCHVEKRKTINGDDILFAMHSLGFDNYHDSLRLYLQKYREANKTDRDRAGAPKDDSAAVAAASGVNAAQMNQQALATYQQQQQFVFQSQLPTDEG